MSATVLSARVGKACGEFTLRRPPELSPLRSSHAQGARVTGARDGRGATPASCEQTRLCGSTCLRVQTTQTTQHQTTSQKARFFCCWPSMGDWSVGAISFYLVRSRSDLAYSRAGFLFFSSRCAHNP